MNDSCEKYVCAHCLAPVHADKIERVGLKMYCRECADKFSMAVADIMIEQLVTAPGRS